MKIINIRNDRDRGEQEPRDCGHENRKSTIHAGLKRVACETCKQVHVDFVDNANTGVLFRVSRLG
ncbi:MAG: hypothetical protein H0U53_00525 [Actinobacteria bacterium]|nr:hypothetical protein [Actinomycetota bacterium]